MKKSLDKMKRRKLARPLVTFEAGADRRALVLATFGLGNAAIMRDTGLSGGQINYRLSKAKRVAQHMDGYRVRYRNGTNPMVFRIISDYSALVDAEIDAEVTERIVHPAAKVKDD